MSKAAKWDYEQCKNELAFIQSVNPKAPGKQFSCDVETFAHYCNAQANHILFSGFPLIAHDVTQCRDIAKSNYRSEMRKQGHETVNHYSFPYGLYKELREEIKG